MPADACYKPTISNETTDIHRLTLRESESPGCDHDKIDFAVVRKFGLTLMHANVLTHLLTHCTINFGAGGVVKWCSQKQ
jgi:hypothetical protein